MLLGPALWVFSLALLASIAPRSYGQYVYFDSDGDSLYTAMDALNSSGWTALDIWIATDRNKDGSVPACSTGSSPLSINSYEITLQVQDGTVLWGSYVNNIPQFTTSFGEASSMVAYHNGFGSNYSLPPGRYKLGTIMVSPSSGSPSLQFATSSELSGAYSTAFGSSCPGKDNDNTLKLGADWFDSDGVALGGTAGSTAQTVTATRGSLFLGGNRIDPPFTLYFHHGLLVVNGLHLEPPGASEVLPSPAVIAQQGLMDALDAYATRLRADGVPESELAGQVAVRYRESPLVQTANPTTGGTIVVTFVDGKRVVKSLPPATPRVPVPLSERRRKRLAELKSDLDAGRVVFVVSHTTKTVIPVSRAKDALQAVERARSRYDLSPSERQLLTDQVVRQLQQPVELVRIVSEGGGE
jgi:hypothetical protein